MSIHDELPETVSYARVYDGLDALKAVQLASVLISLNLQKLPRLQGMQSEAKLIPTSDVQAPSSHETESPLPSGQYAAIGHR